LLTHRPNPKLEDHPLSAVRDYIFSIFAATVRIWRLSPPSPPRDTPRRGDKGPHLTWLEFVHINYLILSFLRSVWNRTWITVFRN